MTLHDLNIDDAALGSLCLQYGVRRLWLFGSITRPVFRSDSDVDVLIEPQGPLGLLTLGGLSEDLRSLFNREIHLTTLGSVPVEQRTLLLRAAQLQYAA